jgi:hypothetical protein
MQLTTLKAIIAGATKGRWRKNKQDCHSWVGTPTAEVASFVHSPNPDADATHIATFNPQLCAALVAVAEVGSRVCRHQASVDTLRYALDALSDAMEGKP